MAQLISLSELPDDLTAMFDAVSCLASYELRPGTGTKHSPNDFIPIQKETLRRNRTQELVAVFFPLTKNLDCFWFLMPQRKNILILFGLNPDQLCQGVLHLVAANEPCYLGMLNGHSNSKGTTGLFWS